MNKKLIVLVIILFSFNLNLYAACDKEELIKEAEAVEVSATPQQSDEGDLYFLILVSKMKNNMALVVSEDDNNTKITYKYFNTNKGVLEIKNDYIFKKINYTIKIYSLDNACKNMLLATKKVSTIKYNPYSKFDVCQGNELFDMCKPFYEGEIASKEVFNNALEEYLKEKNVNNWGKIFDVIKEYYLYVLIPILIVTAGYYVQTSINKWRKRR